jgi:hypothetical protein
MPFCGRFQLFLLLFLYSLVEVYLEKVSTVLCVVTSRMLNLDEHVLYSGPQHGFLSFFPRKRSGSVYLKLGGDPGLCKK